MKSIYTIILSLGMLNSIGQSKNIYGEIHIESFIYKNDTFSFKTPKIITIRNVGATPITTLGKLKQNEFAVQYELIKSNIGQSEYYMLGKVFLIKDSKGWKEIPRLEYQYVIFNEGSPPTVIPNINQGIYGAEKDGSSGFEFGSWYSFYKE